MFSLKGHNYKQQQRCSEPLTKAAHERVLFSFTDRESIAHRSQFSNLLLHHASWVWHNPQFKMSCCFPLIISLKFDPIKVSVLFVFPFLKKWESICHRSVQMDLRPPFNVPVMAFKYRIPLPSTTSLKHRLPMVIKCNILVDWACAPQGVAAGWPCCLPEWVCVCFCFKKKQQQKRLFIAIFQMPRNKQPVCQNFKMAFIKDPF